MTKDEDPWADFDRELRALMKRRKLAVEEKKGEVRGVR